MNYDKMEAGREMDVAIAEKVMGLIPQKDFGSWPEHEWKIGERGEIARLDLSEYHMGPQCLRCYYCYCDGCCEGEKGPCEKKPKPYSTSISAAWEVVEKLTAGENGCFELQQDFGGRFNASFYIMLSLDDPRREGGRYGNWQYECEDADTAPLAICRAALKAVEKASP
jgi:hypothetical protein